MIILWIISVFGTFFAKNNTNVYLAIFMPIITTLENFNDLERLESVNEAELILKAANKYYSLDSSHERGLMKNI